MQKKNLKLTDLVFAFLMPMLVGKSLIVYFGGYYASHPGEGYGYALCAAILFTISMALRFLWKYRKYRDSDEVRDSG